MSYIQRGLRSLVVLLLLVAAAGAEGAQNSENGTRLSREALTAAKAGDWSAAWRDAGAANDPVLQTVLRWLSLTRGTSDVHFADYAAFLTAHPDWPGQKAMRHHAEDLMAVVPDSVLAPWFAQHPPETVTGKLRESQLWADQGRNAESIELIRQVWIDSDFTNFDEKSMLQRYHGVLRPIDHEHRLDRLLWDGQIEQAKRALRLVDPAWRALAAARMSLAALEPGVERLVARVPAELQQDPGLLYERVRWRRRKERYDDAIAILESGPKDPGHPDAWATERQVLARYALTHGKAALAYRIAAQHHLTEGANFAELEFLAGWTALRYLREPDVAYNHFVHLYDAVKLPISIARGAYWAARAAEAMGKSELASSWYGKAAVHITTYYGQLAATHLGDANSAAVVHEPQPTSEDIATFDRRDLVQAVRLFAQLGDADEVRYFLRQVSMTAASPAAHALTAKLALQINRPDLAIAAAKRASYAGVTLLAEGYPIPELPQGGNVERPLILAMTRQESAFDGGAVSTAGARGLMQLMPATASEVAKSLGTPFSMVRLTTDFHYNITLGRAYLEGLLGDFSGSYVLAVASYNAGPARVRQWLQDFGDPRAKGADVIDWIESIPVAETRNYVQRVLENLQVYRLRIGDRSLAFSLATDLKR